MKPANILVFKDYRVKVGDLGISIKLENKIPEDQKHYNLKGLTKGFVSSYTIDAFKKMSKFSKQELF